MYIYLKRNVRSYTFTASLASVAAAGVAAAGVATAGVATAGVAIVGGVSMEIQETKHSNKNFNNFKLLNLVFKTNV